MLVKSKLLALFAVSALAVACAGGNGNSNTGIMPNIKSSGGNQPFASTTNPNWSVGNYTSSSKTLNHASASYNASTGTASFNFGSNLYTALLTTNNKSLVGNLTNRTLTDSISITNMSATATFIDQNGGGCTPDNQSVRFYFQTSGKFAYTNFWWSNPESLPLTNNASGAITQAVNAPGAWSDWNGQVGNSSAAVQAAFTKAIANVTKVGLSFGGGCFFENGVTASDGTGTFSSTFTE